MRTANSENRSRGDVVNRQVAARLEEVADVLERQGANPYRVAAYRRGAGVVRGLDRSVAAIVRDGGLVHLEALPAIGPVLGRAIRELVLTGRLPMLQRLRGEADPVDLLSTVPGVGRRTADRVHSELGLETLGWGQLATGWSSMSMGRAASVATPSSPRAAGPWRDAAW